MKIQEVYQKILTELEAGHRGLQRFSSNELEELNMHLVDILARQDWPEMVALLCVIEHSASLYGKFEAGLIKVLTSTTTPDNIIVFALNCSRKHIVDARFQKGHRLEFEFLETLKNLLFHPNPEVVEWTLRLIESCGNQGIYFLKEFDKIKPPPWKWFNAHQRAVREIITLLERRWSPFEKSKSRSS